MKVRVQAHTWSNIRIVLVLLFVLAIFVAAPLTYYYVKFARMIDRRFSGDIFQNTSKIFAAPSTLSVGQAIRPSDITTRLRRAGYVEKDKGSSRRGEFRYTRQGLEILPGPDSYFLGEDHRVRIEFSEGRIARFAPLGKRSVASDAESELLTYELEPELMTHLFDQRREKRRLVAYGDIPKVLIEALLSAEDKRFFAHRGFDPLRILRAAFTDVTRMEKAQGGSTLTQQVARNFFLTPTKTFRRKLAEFYLALIIEQRLTKEQILELYANQVYLGQRGSFSIRGFGEAASAYFNKELKSLTLPEVALLAGIIRAPNLYAPSRNADRARERRNWVLQAMYENGYLRAEERDQAMKAPIQVLPPNYDYGDAPYFVDMLRDQLLDKYSEQDLITQPFQIYTSIDLELQRAAFEAVRDGIAEVDKLVAAKKRRAKPKKGEEAAPEKFDITEMPQAALIAIDPRTGEVRALVGGRDYGRSQLNHVLAKRQPGSAFKPFVYATAFASALDGSQPVITPVTRVVDEPTIFTFEDKTYEPDNFGEEYHGVVTVRRAIEKSLNVPAVRVAEMITYEKVAEFARSMGLNVRIKGTPSVALGAYDVTPLELTAAYTAFANGGVRVEPIFVKKIVSATGEELERNSTKSRPVVDPRVAYLITNMMEGVMNNGTAAGVRGRGFTLPAAGKTGTSRDAWFAGYTSGLLCVVWVGYDDNRDIKLEGAKAALPIWTYFMKKAAELRPREIGGAEFVAPEGIVTAKVDTDTGELANSGCPNTRDEVFIAGSEPKQHCHQHGGSFLSFLRRVLAFGRGGH